MFLQCFPISPKDPFAFYPLLSLSLISRFLIFSSLCLYLRLCHLHTNILVSLISYILDSPHNLFLFTSGFVLNSCKGGTYNYCFRFCSSPNPSPFTVLIFTVRERNLWNSLMLWDQRAVGYPERSHIASLHPPSHCSSYINQLVCCMGLYLKSLSKP